MADYVNLIADNDDYPDDGDYELHVAVTEIELPQLAKVAKMTFGEFDDLVEYALTGQYPSETEGYFIDLGDEGAAWMEAETFEKYYDKVPATMH